MDSGDFVAAPELSVAAATSVLSYLTATQSTVVASQKHYFEIPTVVDVYLKCYFAEESIAAAAVDLKGYLAVRSTSVVVVAAAAAVAYPQHHFVAELVGFVAYLWH